MRKPRPPEPRHRHHARPPSLEDGELGYTPTAEARWQRERPTPPGTYAVVGRSGGLWMGETRHTRDDWRGWWASAPIQVTRGLNRPLPPCPSWDEPDEPQDG